MERVAKIDFSRKSLFMAFGIDFYCFLEAFGSRFSGLLEHARK